MSEPEQVIREALNCVWAGREGTNSYVVGEPARTEALAALNALVARIQHAEDRTVCDGCGLDCDESGRAIGDCGFSVCDGEMISASDLPAALRAMHRRLEDEREETSAAEARVSELERERDRLRETVDASVSQDGWQERAEAAEARMAALVETINEEHEATRSWLRRSA